MKKLFIISLFMLVNVAQAKDTLNLVYFDVPPFEFIENGQPKGIIVEVVLEICKMMDVDCNLNYLPFKRAKTVVLEHETTQQDAIFLFYKNPEREKIYAYTDLMAEHKILFFKNAASDFNFSGDLLDGSLKKYTIGYSSGYYLSKEFDEAKKRNLINVETNPYHVLNFKKLINNSLDAYLNGEVAGKWIIKKDLTDFLEQYNARLEMIDKPVQITYTYMAFSKENPKAKKYIPLINQNLQALRDNGFYQSKFDEYLSGWQMRNELNKPK